MFDVAIDLDGRRVASGGTDEWVRVWDWRKGGLEEGGGDGSQT